MKIQQSSLALAGYAHAETATTTRNSTRIRPQTDPAPRSGDWVTLSGQPPATLETEPPAEGFNLRDALEQHPLWGVVKRLITALTGEEPDMEAIAPASGKSGSEKSSLEGSAPAEAPAARPATRVEVSTLTVRVDSESVAFSASGEVRTEDGRSITLDTRLRLARQTRTVTSSTVTDAAAPNRKDPLVINFSAASASLNGARIAFDVNADGVAENVAFLSEGSGFLALDRNGDRMINDGRELFGALSGDGFADLSLFDEDTNGWIDENDAIWNRLLLWSKEASGQNSLRTLRDAGIGAIALQRAATAFTLRGLDREDLGALRSTGVFLHEDGRAGTVQQLDLTV